MEEMERDSRLRLIEEVDACGPRSATFRDFRLVTPLNRFVTD